MVIGFLFFEVCSTYPKALNLLERILREEGIEASAKMIQVNQMKGPSKINSPVHLRLEYMGKISRKPTETIPAILVKIVEFFKQWDFRRNPI